LRGGSRRRARWRGSGRGIGTARAEGPRRGDRRNDASDEPAGCGHVVARRVAADRPGRSPLTHAIGPATLLRVAPRPALGTHFGDIWPLVMARSLRALLIGHRPGRSARSGRHPDHTQRGDDPGLPAQRATGVHNVHREGKLATKLGVEQFGRGATESGTAPSADSCRLISRTNHGQMIKGPTAAVGDQASDLRLIGSGGWI